MVHINFTLNPGVREKIKASVIISPKELISFWQEAQACQDYAYLIHLIMICQPKCQPLGWKIPFLFRTLASILMSIYLAFGQTMSSGDQSYEIDPKINSDLFYTISYV